MSELAKYTDWAVDASGNVVASAQVAVASALHDGTVTIYSSAAGASLANPFTAGADGYFEFYADPGVYDVTVGTAPSAATDRWNAGAIRLTPQHFGAKGDGVTDDTDAVIAAIEYGAPLDWGDSTYLITSPIAATAAKLDWVGSRAVIKYGGNYVREAVKITCGIGASHRVQGVSFNANSLANVAAKFVAATVDEVASLWPRIYISDANFANAYRQDQTYPDGDGLRVDGGFYVADVRNVIVANCKMADGAEVSGSQGIFGITFGSNGDRRCRAIRLSGFRVENVWSERTDWTADQDAVRVFQELDERTSSCLIENGEIINVSNRAIKLHSGVNATIRGIYRELSASVIPQSGAFGNPDIDSQQAPATVTDCRFHYDGAWHDVMVQNYTQVYDYGGQVVDGITARIRNASGNIITAVSFNAEDGSDTQWRAVVSNIAIDGELNDFVSVNLRGSQVNTVSLANATGQITGAAVTALGGSATLRATLAGVHNTSGATVALTSGFTAGRDCMAVACAGFDDEIRLDYNNPSIALTDTNPGGTGTHEIRAVSGTLVLDADRDNETAGAVVVRVAGTNELLVKTGRMIIPAPIVPTGASATGDAGTIAWDADYIYVCTATNTWKRAALATW